MRTITPIGTRLMASRTRTLSSTVPLQRVPLRRLFCYSILFFLEYGVVFDGFGVRDFCFLLCFLGVKIESLSGFWFVLYGNCV